MPRNLKTIDTIDGLDEVFDRSFERPVVLFKHSRNCGISSHVLEIVEAIGSEINIVVVQDARQVSDLIAERTGRRHHTPQAFVIHHGKAVYHATHYGIDPEAIGRAVTRAATEATEEARA